MSIDVAAIRQKLAKLTKQNKNIVWKPTGEHTVRLVPLGSDPFKERYFYYIFPQNPSGVVAPGPTFGKPDPVAEFAAKLRQEGTPEARLQAKLLSPRIRVFAPIIVRGEEAEGVRWWGFGKKVYEKLLNYLLDEEWDDITDIAKGHDLKVSFTKSSPGKQFPDTDCTPKPKSSKLSEDAKLVKQWLENIPQLDEAFEVKTFDELSSMLDRWLNTESSDTQSSQGKRSDESVDSSSEHKEKLDDAFKDLLVKDEDDDDK